MSDPEFDFIAAQIGPDARPTGRLRMAAFADSCRLQQKWVGCLGSVWMEVPFVEVPYLPPQMHRFSAKNWAVDATEEIED